MRRRGSAATLTALCALGFVSCGGGNGEDGSSSPPSDSGASAVRLSISASDGRGISEKATLECGEQSSNATGFPGREAADLCALARRLAPFMAKQPDPRRACTEIYGGPETAHIRGTIERRQIDRRFSRTDGCNIADWDRVAHLLPIEAGRGR